MTKEKLGKYQTLEKVKKSYFGEIEKLESDCMKITSSISTEAKGGEQKLKDDSYARMIDRKEEIEVIISNIEIEQREIKEAILSVEDLTERRVLELRYILGHSWEYISDSLSYSRMSVNRMHNSALQKVVTL